jgi:hypothetical protein
MKVDKLKPVEAQEEFAKIPERRVGQWTEIFVAMKKDKQPVRITGITHGQVAALRRKAKEEGFPAKSIEKGTGVLLLPPEKKS